jgi:hypothetical protein
VVADPFVRLKEILRAEAELNRRRRRLGARKAEAIEEALMRGHSWVDIGRALGISRQGARQRWGHLIFARDHGPERLGLKPRVQPDPGSGGRR